MSVKNALIAADADLVGAAFRDRLAIIEPETSALESGRTPRPAAGDWKRTNRFCMLQDRIPREYCKGQGSD